MNYVLDIMMYHVPVVYMIYAYLVHGWYTLPFWVTFIALTLTPFCYYRNQTLHPPWNLVLSGDLQHCEDWTRWTLLSKTTHHPSLGWYGVTQMYPKRYVFRCFQLFSPVQIRKGRDPRSFVPILLNPFKQCAMSLLSAVIMIPNYWKVVYST